MSFFLSLFLSFDLSLYQFCANKRVRMHVSLLRKKE